MQGNKKEGEKMNKLRKWLIKKIVGKSCVIVNCFITLGGEKVKVNEDICLINSDIIPIYSTTDKSFVDLDKKYLDKYYW